MVHYPGYVFMFGIPFFAECYSDPKVFSCEHWEFFKNNFFIEHLRVLLLEYSTYNVIWL